MRKIPFIASLILAGLALSCQQATPEPQPPAAAAKSATQQLEYQGVLLFNPPLVEAAIKALNDLADDLVPAEGAKRAPLIIRDQIRTIVDLDQFTRDARNRPRANAIAFVISGLELIWINWRNPVMVELNKDYEQGAKQPVYVVAAFIAHELAHVHFPCEMFAAHDLQLTIIEEFQKRGLLTGYEKYVADAKTRASQPHPNQHPCSDKK